MNGELKREFISDLIESVRKSVLAAVPEMPDEWNGIELREYIAERFNQQRHAMNGRRKAEYDNDVLTRNL